MPKNGSVSLQDRIRSLLAWIILSSLLAAGIAHWGEKQEQENLRSSGEELLFTNSAHWLRLSGVGMKQFVEDYSWWDEMVEFVGDPDPEWARINFEDMLGFWQVSGVWVFDQSGYQTYQLAVEDYPQLEFPLDQLTTLQTVRLQPFPHFFKKTPQGWLELRGAPVQRGDDEDRSSQAQGWFFVGRIWDDTFFQALRPMDTIEFTVREPTEATAPHSISVLKASHPLADEAGHTIAVLDVVHDTPEIIEWTEAGIDETTLWIVFALLNVVVLGVVLQWGIAQPLRKTAEALRRNDIAPIAALTESPHEFGEISRLIKASFEHQEVLCQETDRRRATETALRESEKSLRRALKERAQLSLDLHDSAIQVLYASGLSLSAIESRLSPQAPLECRKIRHVSENLQRVVDDLRRFIADAETDQPEKTKPSLSDLIEELLALMRSSNQIQIESKIDAGIEKALTADQSINLLQILREGMSNGMRHSQADTMWVELRVRPQLVRLVIEDNGIGLSPEEISNPKRGLRNIRQRARAINAELDFSARPGGGTRIDLKFSTSYHP